MKPIKNTEIQSRTKLKNLIKKGKVLISEYHEYHKNTRMLTQEESINLVNCYSWKGHHFSCFFRTIEDEVESDLGNFSWKYFWNVI